MERIAIICEMNEQKNLLDDVLAEASPPDFRAALLGETLRLARRRRQWRHTRQTGGVLAVMVLIALLTRQNRPEKISSAPTPAKIPVAKSYQLVETRTLPAGAVVATGNFSAVKIISSESSVAQIATTGGGFRFINDAQLLALVGGHPAVLIRTGPDSAELVFANPEDQKLLGPH